MPWLDTARFAERCTACRACMDACPEGIVAAADGGLPAIDFARGGCTFCAACAQACPEHLFVPHERPPWPHRAVIGTGCLTRQGVVCRSCQDACEVRAIRFAPAPGAVAQPSLDAGTCTGCGACVGACPVDAIGWTVPAAVRLEPAQVRARAR